MVLDSKACQERLPSREAELPLLELAHVQATASCRAVCRERLGHERSSGHCSRWSRVLWGR